MRLQEVYAICQDVQDSWCDLAFEERKGTGNITYYKLSNANRIRTLLHKLGPIISFSESIENVKKTSVGFNQPAAEIYLDSSDKSTLTTEYQRLLNRVITVTELFESLNYSQSMNGIDIKMPPQISLYDLSKCTRDLNTFFSTCPLFTQTDNTITLSTVDVGSIWLSFVVGGVAIAAVIGAVAELVDKAIIIRSHYLTTKEQEETIRSLEMGNDTLEELSKINKEAGKRLLDKVSIELAAKHEINDPEDIERLKNSLQLLSDWMSRGMEIYASVQSPTETKAVFPPLEKQSLPENAFALLSDRASGNQEDT